LTQIGVDWNLQDISLFNPTSLRRIAEDTGFSVCTLTSSVREADGASNDTTTDIIKNFSKNSSFPVKLDINQKRLGSTQNFEKAIRFCNSNIIFLCGQDYVFAR